jgi:hypothetical protein
LSNNCLPGALTDNWLFVEVEVEITLWLTVSQYVLESSPLWDLWPDITSCRKVADLFLWGTKVQVPVILLPTVSRRVRLGVGPRRSYSGTCDQILLLVGRMLSENCSLFLWGAFSDERTGLQFAVQSLSGPGRAEPVTILCCLIWDSPQPEGPGSRIYIPQKQRGPVILPGTGFLLRRLLRLAGLWWRYSNPPRTWRTESPHIYTRSFPAAYSTYSSEYFVQNSLTNLWSIFNSYGVKLDFRNAMLPPPPWAIMRSSQLCQQIR